MKKWVAIGLILLMVLGLTPRARALFGVGDVVFDPTQFTQLLLDYTVQLEQYAAEAEQLANQVLELENWAIDLTQLNIPIITKLFAVVERAFQLLEGAKGLAFKASHLHGELTVLYPEWDGEMLQGQDFPLRQQQWLLQVRQANETAMESQAVLEDLQADQRVLENRVSISDGTTGNLAAAQAGNQLTALAVGQLLRMQEMMAAQGRAQSSKDMLAAEEQNAAMTNAAMKMECFSCMEPVQGYTVLPVLR